MRKRIVTILSASGVAAMAIGLGSTSVLAVASTWTIKPGGSITATAHKTVLTDSKTGAVLTCTDSPGSKAAGTLKSGSGKTNPIGNIKSISFSGCTGPAGLKFKVSTSAFPWKIDALKYSSGVTHGKITGIHAVLKGTNSSCTAVVDGTAAGKDNGKVAISHSNGAPAKLKVLKSGGNLHAYKVSGCLGALNSGDAVTYTATYTLNHGQKITSP